MAIKKVWTAALALTFLFMLLAVVIPSGAEAAAPSSRASHILVSTEAKADELLEQINQADDLAAKFAELAKEFSTCPSRRKGGDLGTFGRGQMVPEFDRVAFESTMGVVHKVKTQFGWHLVLVTERSGVDEAAIKAKAESEDSRDL